VLARKTGAGALRRPVLVALGLRPDGKKEIIDFRLAASESAAEWEKFLADLYRRGLTGEGLHMICVDGGSGLLAALPSVLHGIPVQRCWAGSLKKSPTPDSVVLNDSRWRGRGMLGHKERDQLELFITGSLRQLIPDEHVLARVDRVLDLS
jgi:hypothetical protein